MEATRDQVVRRFRARLNEFKRPLIEMTLSEKDGLQETDTLSNVMKQIQILYGMLQSAVEREGRLSAEEAGEPVIQIFTKDGLFEAIQSDPTLKPDLVRYLYLDLYMYPYTLNPTHINSLASAHTVSHQREIISNRIDAPP